jgi:transposase
LDVLVSPELRSILGRRSAMEKFKVTLAEDERQALGLLVSAGKAAARKLAHARVLLLSDEGPVGPGRTDEEIVEALNVSPSTVARVRKRFVVESREAALDHKPQPARPDKVKINDAVEERSIELACSDPPKGRCRWTLQLLADRLVALGCVASVSREGVRQALKETTSVPGW